MAHIRSLFFCGPVQPAEDRALAALAAGRPSHVVWNVTDRCNLKCRHCYMGATGARAEGELTRDEALDLVRRLGEAGVPTLFVTGGEMFTRPDIWEILEEAHAQGIRLVVSTNGTLLTASDAERLAHLGVDFAAISIYGPPAFHDSYVMVERAYAATLRAAEALTQAGIGLCVKTTVNQDTWPHVPYVFETARRIGAKVVYPCDLVTTGRASDMARRSITVGQWRELADLIIREVTEDPDGLEFDIGANPSIVPYVAERLAREGHDVSAVTERLHRMSACPVGHGHLAINARGDIMPCQFMQDYSVGNVRETDLADAVTALFELGRAPVSGPCGTCEHSRTCRGCRAKAHCATGDVLGPDPACMLEAETASAR
ncbi:MAG: radical SAM protein [Coriobacteriia bacterium]